MKYSRILWMVAAGALSALGCGNGGSSTSNGGGSSGAGAGGSGNAAGNSGSTAGNSGSAGASGGSGISGSGSRTATSGAASGSSGGGTGNGSGTGSGASSGVVGGSDAGNLTDGAGVVSSDGASGGTAHLPLVLVSEVDLPGGATRFDYQDIDPARGYLVIAHMNDNAALIVNLSDGSVVKQFPGIPVARGIAVADDVGRIFVTSSPHSLVIIDNMTLTEISRVTTGAGPDGDGWDPVHKVVGVSDQSAGAISLIAGAGSGTATQIPLGTTTGNVLFDSSRGWFWITVVTATPPNQLVAVDPVAGTVVTRINLPGCVGAHGLRFHPDYQSAFIACETNYVIARVDLGGTHAVATAPTGIQPDVMSIDPGLGWLYVAAESGDLTVWDINKPGVALIGHDQPGTNSHTIATDPSTHRVFFPLMAGPKGTPVLRIMKPSGT